MLVTVQIDCQKQYLSEVEQGTVFSRMNGAYRMVSVE